MTARVLSGPNQAVVVVSAEIHVVWTPTVRCRLCGSPVKPWRSPRKVDQGLVFVRPRLRRWSDGGERSGKPPNPELGSAGGL